MLVSVPGNSNRSSLDSHRYAPVVWPGAGAPLRLDSMATILCLALESVGNECPPSIELLLVHLEVSLLSEK